MYRLWWIICCRRPSKFRPSRNPHSLLLLQVLHEGSPMKLRCSFCKIVFDCPNFEAVAEIQGQQCYITRKGITHKLSELHGKGSFNE